MALSHRLVSLCRGGGSGGGWGERASQGLPLEHGTPRFQGRLSPLSFPPTLGRSSHGSIFQVRTLRPRLAAADMCRLATGPRGHLSGGAGPGLEFPAAPHL